jgi:hypothetical protein
LKVLSLVPVSARSIEEAMQFLSPNDRYAENGHTPTPIALRVAAADLERRIGYDPAGPSALPTRAASHTSAYLP